MIKVRTLGGVCITDEQGSPIALRSRKHVGLLLVLLGGTSRVFPRSRLCDLFWASDKKKARHSLSQALYDLARNLGPVIQRGPSEDVSIDRSRLDYDVREFESALKEGDLETAVELYQGPFADNLVDIGTDDFERWVDSERTRLGRLGELVLRRYLIECESRGSWGKMCVAALRLTAINPLDEEAHRTLIRGLWLSGDTSSALRHFDDIKGRFEKLPSGVSTQLDALVQHIRLHPEQESGEVRSVNREPPLVGRESEFRQLREVALSADSQRLAAIVVSGEAGIGKSRLVSELQRSLSVEHIELLDSRCFQAEEDLPYTPVVDALSAILQELFAEEPELWDRHPRLPHLFPDLGQGQCAEPAKIEDPATWQRLLYEEVVSLLQAVCKRKPVVWIIEDVQWMDRASQALVHHLMRRLQDDPFLLIFTARSSRAGKLLTNMPLLKSGTSQAVSMLRLSALGEQSMKDLVRHAAPLKPEHPALELAVRLSAGNPYYALEVLEVAGDSSEWAQVATTWDPLDDERLRELLRVRLGGLRSESLQVLKAIAVLERHARPRLIASVAGCSLSETARAAEELYERGLVADEEERISFVNDAMREFVNGELSTLERAVLHLKAGQVLEAEGASSPGVLATHLYHGDDWPRCFGYAMEAACDARRASGNREAAHFATMAAKVAPGAAERAAALTTCAESLFAAGDLDGAADNYRSVLTSCQPVDASELADIYLKLAATEIERCRWGDAADVVAKSRGVVGRVRAPEAQLYLRAERATLLLKYAVRTADQHAADEASLNINSALSGLRGLTAAAAETWLAVLSAKAMLLGVEGNSREALDYLERAGKHLQETDKGQAARYFNYRGVVKAWLADWDGAEADFIKARRIADETGDRVGLTTQWNNLACVALERGEWAEAQNRLDTAKKVQGCLGFSHDASLPLTLNQADLYFYQGYLAKAERRYAEAIRMCEQQESSDRRSEAIACLGLVAIQRGKKEEAARLWTRLQELEASNSPSLGTRERFKVAWFRSSMETSSRERPLLAAAERERQRDLPSHLKLRWLSAILETASNVGHAEIKRALYENSLGWFCHVSNRWARSTGASMRAP